MRLKDPVSPVLGPFPACQYLQALFERAEAAEVVFHHTFQLSARGWLTHRKPRDLSSHLVHLAERSHHPPVSVFPLIFQILFLLFCGTY